MSKARAGDVRPGIGSIECCVDRAIALATVLGVVKDVEVFPLEFEAAPFIDREPLEGAEVEVQTARQVQRVTPDVAKGETGRNREGCRIEDERPAHASGIGVGYGVRIANQIR